MIVGDDQRDELAVLLHRALQEHDPCATPAHHEKADEFAQQGAALIVLVSAPVPDHKIPVWEQQLSAGAAGMQLLNAAHALGFVGGWITGWQAYSPTRQRGLLRGGRTDRRVHLSRPSRRGAGRAAAAAAGQRRKALGSTKRLTITRNAVL